MTDFSTQRSLVHDSLGLVELSGEVDLYTAPRFKADLLELVESGVDTVVVDLSRVTFIDSTALGVIIGGVKRMRERDGRLVDRGRLAPGGADPRHHRPRQGAHRLRYARRCARRPLATRRRLACRSVSSPAVCGLAHLLRPARA